MGGQQLVVRRTKGHGLGKGVQRVSRQIYELVWKIRCLDFEFVTAQWKVLDSEAEAQTYGYHWQNEANDGLPVYEKAEDGYCYQFMGAYPVDKVDGYQVLLVDAR